VTGGEPALPPSWEQLLTGAHPSFAAASASAGDGGRGLARHGRDGWRAAGDVLDALEPGDPSHCRENDGMGWGEAAMWTVVAAGVASVLTSRLGGLLH
jgi:hypothetical protein